MAPTSRPRDDEDPFRSKHGYVMSRLQERQVHLRRRDPRRVRDREGPVPRRAPWLREYATGVLGGRRFVLRDTWGPAKGAAARWQEEAPARANAKNSSRVTSTNYFPGGTRRNESIAATAAAMVNTVKASVKPSIEGVRVRPAAATVEATATQMAAPSWLQVLTMPDTSPASCRPTRPRAVVVAQTNSEPPPSANTTKPGRTSA